MPQFDNFLHVCTRCISFVIFSVFILECTFLTFFKLPFYITGCILSISPGLGKFIAWWCGDNMTYVTCFFLRLKDCLLHSVAFYYRISIMDLERIVITDDKKLVRRLFWLIACIYSMAPASPRISIQFYGLIEFSSTKLHSIDIRSPCNCIVLQMRNIWKTAPVMLKKAL